MTFTSTGLTLAWPVIALLLLFDLILYVGAVWLRQRAVALQRARDLDDYLGMLHAVEAIGAYQADSYNMLEQISDVLTASLTEQEQINATLRDTETK